MTIANASSKRQPALPRAVRLRTLGQRPQDYRDRDLLLASLMRDPRLPMYRRMCWKPPDWAPGVPATVPPKLHRQGQQLQMLRSFHENLLRRMREELHLAEQQAQATKLLDAAEQCPPRGGLFEREFQPGTARPCGYSRLCPWCHARRIQQLYRRLRKGPCAPARLQDHCLILGKLSVPLKLGLVLRHEGEPDEDHEYVKQERKTAVEHLRSLAKTLGVVGGVIITQVGPWSRFSGGSRYAGEYSLEVAFIGDLPCCTGPAMDLVKRRTICGQLDLANDLEFTFYPMIWALVPGSNPQALRYLLFGTSYKSGVDRLGLAVCSSVGDRYGLSGAAALPPWFLFEPQQAWDYYGAMRGVRLFDLFGTWRRRPTTLPATGGSSRSTGHQEIGRRRRQALTEGNGLRQQSAARRRESLLAAATQAYNELASTLDRQPGSPALRQALTE